MDNFIKHMLDTLSDLGRNQQLAVLSVDEGGQEGLIAGGFNQGQLVVPSKPVSFVGTPVQDIIAHKEADVYAGMLLESLPFPTYEDSQSGFKCLCLPLLGDHQEIKGVTVLSQQKNSSEDTYQKQTISILRAFTMTAVENARLLELATIDGLTRLFTRHYFDIRLQEEFTRIRRHNGVMSLAMIDIDRFKDLNSTYGYKQGNKVLREVAELIKAAIRKEIDIPCRYGGEQFALLLPSTGIEGAYVVAERIRQRCEEHHPLQDDSLQVTVSIGLADSAGNISSEQQAQLVDAGLEIDRISKEELLHRADLMLFAAKQAGRNQTMVWW